MVITNPFCFTKQQNFAWTPLCGRFFSYLLLLPPKRHSVYGSLQIDHLEISEEDRLPPSPHRKALQRLRSLSCSLCCCCCVVEDQEMDNHRFVYWSNFYDSKIYDSKIFRTRKFFGAKIRLNLVAPVRQKRTSLKFSRIFPGFKNSTPNFRKCDSRKRSVINHIILHPACKVSQHLQWYCLLLSRYAKVFSDNMAPPDRLKRIELTRFSAVGIVPKCLCTHDNCDIVNLCL